MGHLIIERFTARHHLFRQSKQKTCRHGGYDLFTCVSLQMAHSPSSCFVTGEGANGSATGSFTSSSTFTSIEGPSSAVGSTSTSIVLMGSASTSTNTMGFAVNSLSSLTGTGGDLTDVTQWYAASTPLATATSAASAAKDKQVSSAFAAILAKKEDMVQRNTRDEHTREILGDKHTRETLR